MDQVRKDNQMKAIVCTKYGPPDVLKLEEIQKPTPGDDEILVEVHAASVNYSNLILVRGKPFVARLGFGLLKPKLKIPGSDIAGRVEAVGRNAKQFLPGDEVFGSPALPVLSNKVKAARTGLGRQLTPTQWVRDDFLGELSLNAVLHWFLGESHNG
jgi:NADPH:quinone reductase-like Zn-dependent oxidoreductase